MTDTETTPEYDAAFEKLDDLQQAVVRKLHGVADEYNANARTLRAASGDSQQLLETLRESSTIPEVAELREKLEKVNQIKFETEQAIDEALKPEVSRLQEEAHGQTEGMDDRNKELKSVFNASRKFFASLVDDDDLVKAVMPKLEGTKSSGKGGSGTGVRRIRHRTWRVEQDGKTQDFDNASGAAKAVNLETTDFQTHFFAAAGSEKQADWPNRVDFNVGNAAVSSIANEQPGASAPASENVVEEDASEEDEGF